MTATPGRGPKLRRPAIGFQEISLASIDLEEYPFGLPPLAVNLDRLRASLEDVGLLAPPWLRPKDQTRWQVVTGWRRLTAAAQLGWERVPARTLPDAFPDSLGLLIHLYDNSFTRGFNLQEQATLTARLLDHWERQTVVTKYLPYLGLPPSPAHLDRLLKLAVLEQPFQQLAAQGRLALTAAALLADWDPQDRAAALVFLEQLPFSQSKQEEFLTEVALYSRREGLSPRDVLDRQELEQLLADEALNPQEKTEAVRRRLKQWFYPRFTAAREAFQRALNRLGLAHNPRMRLLPPPAFEGPDFQLELRFRDGAELENLLQELNRLMDEAEFTYLTKGQFP